MNSFEPDIKKCISVLEKGGSILYPTDTIWGLGCDATNQEAIEKISDLKNRPEQKSFIVLMADTRMLRKYLANPIPDLEGFIAEQTTAITVIYDNIIGIPENALATDGSLGIRIPKDDFCIALLKRYKKPVISTSANLSGEVAPIYFDEINKNVIEKTDYVAAWRREDRTRTEPSKIIKLHSDGTQTTIR